MNTKFTLLSIIVSLFFISCTTDVSKENEDREISVNAGLNGSVSASGVDELTKYVAYGDSINIEAYPDKNCHFISWSNPDSFDIDDPFSSLTKLRNVTQNGVLIANFEVDSHVIFIGTKTEQTTMGSTTPAGNLYYEYGQVINIGAINKAGYKFSYWEISSVGISYDNPCSLTVVTNDTLIANFKVVTCTLSISSSDYGSVPFHSIVVPYNTDTVITITPERGCSFSSWTNPEGFTISDEGEGKYRISGVTKNGTLAANFAIIPAVDGVVYVDKNANENSAKDGTSWYDAYSSLKIALTTEMEGKTFWISKGTYTPIDGLVDPVDSRSHSFVLQSDDTIIGGFDGFNISIPPRDNVVKNITILSGDIGTLDDVSDDSRLIVRTNSKAIIKNVSIQSSDKAIDVWGDGTLIENCVIQKNLGSSIDIHANDVNIKSCIFTENSASEGAAIYIVSPRNNSFRNIVIENSIFMNNETTGGGAIYTNVYTDCVKYINCTIVNNMCTGESTAGLYNRGADTIVNCIIYGNTVPNYPEFIGTQVYNANLYYHCNIQNKDVGEKGIAIIGENASQGVNIDENPNFKSATNFIGSDGYWYTEDDGLHLNSDSPSLDAGNRPSIIRCELPYNDIMGKSRVLGAGGVDMGAYEQ